MHSRMERPVRDDVLDDDHLFARLDLEAAAQLELAVDALGVDGRHAQVPRRLVAGNDAADGRRDDLADAAKAFGPQLFGQRPAELFGLVGMHEHPRLLQEDGERRPEDRMKWPSSSAPHCAEDVEDFVFGHAFALSSTASPFHSANRDAFGFRDRGTAHLRQAGGELERRQHIGQLRQIPHFDFEDDSCGSRAK